MFNFNVYVHIIKLIFLFSISLRKESLIINLFIVFFITVFIFRGYNNFSFIIESMGVVFIILTSWLGLLITKAVINEKNSSEFNLCLNFILVTLTISFLINEFLYYYIWFELSLIPIFIIILGWGYQPERMLASLTIFFYTISASIPLFLCLILYLKSRGSLNYSSLYLSEAVPGLSLSMFLLLGFIVKLPRFGFHLWLPKAHVEAPVIGSIILAGVLLKLGGHGFIISRIIRIIPLISFLLIRVRLAGGAMARIFIISLRDMKVIIAYSSIVHIGMVMSIYLIGWSVGMWGSLLILTSHGFTSSGIFYLANLIYLRSHSRSLILNKGLTRINPNLTIIWFLLIVINFGGPFTSNLIREIFLIISLINLSRMNIIVVFLYCFFSLVYNLILYSSTQQGVQYYSIDKINIIKPVEYLNIFSHIWPSFLIVFILQF